MTYRRVKRLSYRDISGKSVAQVGQAWKGFEFNAGPWVCISEGPWGQCQVWAASASEGLRVLRFALGAGGWNEQDVVRGFRAREAQGGRNGRPGRMRVAVGRGLLGVSKRAGPSGPPNYPEV